MAAALPRVLASGLAFPEGPAFDRDGTLWCVEAKGASLVRLTPSGIERIVVGGVPNGLTRGPRGALWFCDADASALRSFDPSTGDVATLAADVRLTRPNDLAFDAVGTLVFTCPGDSRGEPSGSVWCLPASGDVALVADGLFFPNGLAFADEGRTLIVAETYRQRLWKGDWDSDARRWIDPAPWVDVGGPVGPDGMALDADDRLWVAVYGSGAIAVVGRDGTIVDRLRVPGRNPTNVAFDPSGRLGLIVAEAEHGMLLSFSDLGPGTALHCP